VGVLSPVINQPGHEADHQPIRSIEVKKTWIYTSNFTYDTINVAFMINAGSPVA
jgi:hypothetical protein